MILFLSNGKQLRGDAIISSVLRSDCSPVPLTLEADIRGGEPDFDKFLEEGQKLTCGTGDALRIIKSVRVAHRLEQGGRELAGFRITAALDSCIDIAYPRRAGIFKENASLAAIYQAAGARIKAIDADFPVPRFYCPVGETPTFHIARVLQEEGGIVRWKKQRLQFLRLRDIFRQKASLRIPNTESDTIEGKFLEQHEIPWFFSVDEAGKLIFGNRAKARPARFSPFKNAQRLQNMSRCLIHRKTVKAIHDIRLCAGDTVEFQDGTVQAILTAAHVFKSGSDDGTPPEAFTRLWLASLGE